MKLKRPFDKQIFDVAVGGVSALDILHPGVEDLKEAHEFLRGYGYNPESESDRKELWALHGRSVTFLKETLLGDLNEGIPEQLTDPNELKDIGYLLVLASQDEEKALQKWACAILRVMHVNVHMSHDMTDLFLEDIQKQVLKPIQSHISNTPMLGGTFLGKSSDWDHIKLHRYDVKPLKTSESSMIKLLARPNMVGLKLLDRVGVRFVTRNVFDAFRVLRFLFENHIVSFPQIIPDQSANTLYPMNLFLEVLTEMEGDEVDQNSQDIDEKLHQRLLEKEESAEYIEKDNPFSSRSYRFIKFISRRLVSVKVANGRGGEDGESELSFFFPYEVQIMDYQTYIQNISGPAAHDKYKARQKKAALKRVLGLSLQGQTDFEEKMNGD